MRNTGIKAIGGVPWGTHFCQFYETGQDLIEMLVPYFQEGLAAHEFCMWVTSAPLQAREARAALREAVPDLEERLRQGQIEIIDCSQWYTKSGRFSSHEVLQAWIDKLAAALDRGYEGLRLSGNTFWLEKSDWEDFRLHEEALNGVIGRYKMLAICTYSLKKCGAAEIIEVAANHESALIKHRGRWRVIESSGQGRAERATEQAEVNEALRRERDFSTAVLETAGALVVVLDKAGRISRFNKACEAVTGYSESEVLGRVFWDFLVPEEDLPGVWQTWRALQAGDFPNQYDNHWKAKDGSRRLIGWSNSALTRPNGEIEYIIGTGIDITERRKSREELHRTREHLENLIDYANAPIIVWDPHFNIARFNHAFERLTGLRAAEVIDKPLDILFPEASRDESLAHIQRTLTGERWEVVEIPILGADGTIHTVLWNSANVYEKDGTTLAATIAQGQDISSRVRAEEELRRHAEELEAARIEAENQKLRLEAVMEALPVGVAITDVLGGSIKSNSAFEGIWGGPRPETKSVADYAAYKAWWADTELPLAPEEWASAQAIRKGETVVDQVLQIERFDGSRGFILNSAAPMRDAGGNVIGSAVTIQDITDLRRAQDELYRLNRTLTALSHSNQALMRARNEADFLNEACQIIVKDCGHAMVWIGYAEDDEQKSVRPVASAGFEAGYLETLDISWADTERGCGPTGTAIRTRKSCACTNMLTDPKFAPWREQAVARGYASSLVLPFLAAGRAFGAISIYSTQPEAIPEEERQLLTELAGDVAYGITSIRLREAHAQAEEALRQRTEELQLLTETLGERVQERTAELEEANELLQAEVTHSHFMEDDLKKGKEALQTVIDNIPVMLCFYDSAGKAIMINREFDRLLGWSKEEAEALDIAPARTRQEPAHPGTQVSATDGIPGWREHKLKTRQGDVLESSWATVRLSDGGQIGIGLDMRERREAEREHLRLAAAVEQADKGMAIMDSTGLIIYVNQAFEITSGSVRADLLGRRYYDLLNGDGAAGDLAGDAEKSIRGGEIWSGRLARKTKAGQARELDITISPIRDRSGNVINYLVLERDITQDVRLQQHLRQVQKMEALGTLAGGIAHDFNNILNPIFINTELSLMDAGLDDETRRALEITLRAAERGRDLVKQIITFSRQKEKERKPTKVGPVIKEAVKFLRSSLAMTIEIRQNIEPETGFVLADPTQIHQVVMNLCNNAAYAMQERGGLLDVSLAEIEVDEDIAERHPDLKPGAYLRLTVADTGTGMTPEVMERAFDPFFTTKKPGEGSGMGLAVVHGIVRDYAGAVTIHSEPGRGTTFNIFLPRVPAEEIRPEAEAESLAKGMERILLVDDEDVQVQSIRNMLKRLGYRVTAKTDSAEALKVFRKDPGHFDLIITDQIMPGMTGAQLAQEVLRIRPEMPIILCTGFSDRVDAIGSRALGIREFVMKPFSIREMSGAINRAMKKD